MNKIKANINIRKELLTFEYNNQKEKISIKFIYNNRKDSIFDKSSSKKDKLKEALEGGSFNRVLVLGIEGTRLPWVTEFLGFIPKKTKIAVHCTNEGPWTEVADLVLPNVSAFEKTGTVVNALGRIQKVQQSIACNIPRAMRMLLLLA